MLGLGIEIGIGSRSGLDQLVTYECKSLIAILDNVMFAILCAV